jgi:hypothetical protein
MANRGVVRGLLLLLLGSGMVYGGWTLHQESQQAMENAIETEGTVISTGIDEIEVANDEGSGTHMEYAPEVRYRYSYEGETYTSTSICPGSAEVCAAAEHGDRDDAESFISRYPEDETVTVYVVENDPTMSFLVDTESGSLFHYMLMGLGALLLLGGLQSIYRRLATLGSG